MAETDLKDLFQNLVIEDDDTPLPPVRRGGAAELPNPFAPALQESLDKDTPKTIWIPADAVSRAVFLINRAAAKMTPPRGVRIVVNVERDSNGAVVKGEDGKAKPVVETRGANKGKVQVRFQTLEKRKAMGDRPFSIINDPDNEGGKALRERATNTIVARGTHDEMRAELAKRKQRAAAAA